MKKNQNNFQDLLLNNCRKKKIAVSLFLVNGYNLKGLVKGFDPFTVLIENEGQQMLIYKHAISTVNPSRTIIYDNNYNNEDN